MPTDSLSATTSALSKISEGEGAMIQMLIRPSQGKWKKIGKSYISLTKKSEADPEKATFKTDPKVLERISDKCSKPGFETVIRFVVSAKTKEVAEAHLKNIKTALSQFNSDLNRFKKTKIVFKGGFMMDFIYKFFPVIDLPFVKSILHLSSDELATLFHFPNKTVETPHINWLRAKTAPVPAELSIEKGTFMGFGYYRGVKRPVYISDKDRMRHMYIIGKTGTGKSELLREMIKQDIKKGRGVCVIDPHGDLAEAVIGLFQKSRTNQTIIFDPSDTNWPIAFNMLDNVNPEHRPLVASGLV